MPTGYTCHVQNGETTTLRDFAMICARAFGACITMRDDPIDKQIPERFEPHTDYHDERLREALATLAEMERLDEGEKQARATAHNRECATAYQEWEDREAKEKARYSAMLEQVEAWDVPESLADFRKFMIEQLQTSIDHDCGYRKDPPKPLTPDEWFIQTLQSAALSVEYHTKSRAEEIERTEDRNRWLADLRSALSQQ